MQKQFSYSSNKNSINHWISKEKPPFHGPLRAPSKVSPTGSRRSGLRETLFPMAWWCMSTTSPQSEANPDLSEYGKAFYIWVYGRGSKLNRRGYAGFGPCFHLPGFHFGTGFLATAICQNRHSFGPPPPKKNKKRRSPMGVHSSSPPSRGTKGTLKSNVG